MSTIEIQTTEGGRLSWVAIYQDSDDQRAIRWGDQLLSGFRRGEPRPYLRILDRPLGKVIGAWQGAGYEASE
ncbi:hypothetical protein ACFVU2_21220 [Leifsonia sp. NPDC058194]|uniref:hypothetical protein n=1 Tax=Leifsonia sp. NPDC058194 TaxID=3346374 RepID=UPI0036DDEC31